MKNILRQVLIVAMSATLCLSFATICKGVEYQYIEILPPGWTEAGVTDINNNGVVAGWGIDSSGVTRSFIYSGGIYTYLPLDAKRAYGINDTGVVVGQAKSTGSPEKFFIYSGGALTFLVPDGWLSALALCINNKGDVAGLGVPYDGVPVFTGAFRGFIYSNGTYSFVPPPAWANAFSAETRVSDINNDGVAVGYGGDTFYKKGFIYSNGQYTELQPPGWWREAYAYGINDNGVVVGSCDVDLYNPSSKGFIYNNGVYTFLVPQGWNIVMASDINNYGVVVGNGGFNTNNKGFVYCNGEYTVLVPPGWQWAGAGGINDNGVVIGNGKDVNGAKKGFIAIPQSTLIHLSSFTATPKAGKVIIQWSTEAEIDNAGFNMYRSESEDGNYIKINSSLVPAQGSSTQGASYEFADKNVQNRKTYYFKLEDIDLDGTSTMHGPVNATPRWIWGISGR